MERREEGRKERKRGGESFGLRCSMFSSPGCPPPPIEGQHVREGLVCSYVCMRVHACVSMFVFHTTISSILKQLFDEDEQKDRQISLCSSM